MRNQRTLQIKSIAGDDGWWDTGCKEPTLGGRMFICVWFFGRKRWSEVAGGSLEKMGKSGGR
ncbi:hypothetical protein Hanom_Chr01g00059421 [Helianthus anomalus]